MDGIANYFIAEDPDNRLTILKGQSVTLQQLTYSLQNYPDSVLDGERFFTISTGVNTPSAPQLEINLARSLSFAEAPTSDDGCPLGSGKRCYIIRVRVTDNGSPVRWSEVDIVIEILNTNNPPIFDDVPNILEIPEDVDETTIFSPVLVEYGDSESELFANDPDPGDELTYQLIQGNDRFKIENIPNNKFLVKRKTGISLNFEDTVNSFDIVVRAFDGGPNRRIGSGCSENDACSGEGAFCDLSESRCYETCVDTVEGTNGTIIQQLDPFLWYFCNYEEETPITIFPETAETTFTINVLDRNDPPRFIIDGIQRAGHENCELTGSIAQNLQDEVQILFSDITVEDEDDQVTNSPFGGEPFIFAHGSIELDFWDTFELENINAGKIVSKAPLELLPVDSIYNGSIEVQDSNSPPGISECRITVTVVRDNRRPDLGPDVSVEMEENLPENTLILEGFRGGNLSLIDPDVDCCDDILTFNIPGTSQTFKINSETGRITLGSAGLNFESNKQVSALIRVRDLLQASDNALITINVIDVNERPFWPFNSKNTFEIKEDAIIGSEVGIPFDEIAIDPDIKAYTHGKEEWNKMEFTLINCDGSPSCPFVLDSFNKTQLLVSEDASFDYELGDRSWSFDVIASDLAYLNPLLSLPR
jgi:hypothetical protein